MLIFLELENFWCHLAITFMLISEVINIECRTPFHVIFSFVFWHGTIQQFHVSIFIILKIIFISAILILSPLLVIQVLKEFLRFAEAEVRTLASLYSSVVGAASRCIHSIYNRPVALGYCLCGTWYTLQGRNVDSLILYFGEDPARCPFEQGICSSWVKKCRSISKKQLSGLLLSVSLLI